MNLAYAGRHISRAIKYLFYRVVYGGRKIEDPIKINNILVVSLDLIGDAILTNPLFPALKEAFPNARITVACGSLAKVIYECMPRVSECIEFRANKFTSGKKRWSLRQRLHALARIKKGKKWDLVVCVRGSWEFSLLFYLKAIPNYADTEIVQGRQLWDKYLNKRLPANGIHNRFPDIKYRPYIVLQALQMLGFDYSGPLEIDFELPPIYREQASSLMKENGIDLSKPIISVHPCAAEKAKLWSEARWAAVCDYLTEKVGANILLCGTPDDQQYLETIKNKMNGRAYNLAGKTSLMQLCGVISLSRFCLGIDSGPMHLAAAVEVPALFLIGFDDPSSCAPISDKIDYIFHREGNPERRMIEITVDEVKNKLDAMLSL